jgi:hypothetical protein
MFNLIILLFKETPCLERSVFRKYVNIAFVKMLDFLQ